MRLLRRSAHAASAALGLCVASPVTSAPPVLPGAIAIDACRVQPAAQLGPGDLSRCFYQAVVRSSRAAGHEIPFETGRDADAQTVAAYANAAEVTSEILEHVASLPGGQSDLARVGRVVVTVGAGYAADLSNGVLTVTVPHTNDPPDFPAPEIYVAVREVTCITSLVIERTSQKACFAALDEEVRALRAKGLKAAAPLLIVSANGRVLRGMTTATLAGGHGEVAASDGALSCRGNYDSDSPWQTTEISFRCSDGRTGAAKRTWSISSPVLLDEAHRLQLAQPSLGAEPMISSAEFVGQGEGTLQMSDGEAARFAFGCATRIGEVPTCPPVRAGQSASAAQASRPR